MQEMTSIQKEITSTTVPDPSPLPEISGYNLLVRPIPVKEMTKGGIILPDAVKEDIKYLCNIARVLKIGPYAFKSESFKFGPWLEGGDIKVGDLIVHGRHDGDKIKYKGVVLSLIKDVSVRMRIKNPSDLDTSIDLG